MMAGEIIQGIKDWVWIMGAIAPFLVGAGMLYLQQRFPTKAEHAEQTKALKDAVSELSAKVEQRRTNTDARLSRLEAVTEQLPSRKDIEQLGMRLGEVERSTAVAAEATRGMEKLLGSVARTADMMLQNQLRAEGGR
ncbi:DUF2730 family protein [Azorhizobium doebereinerae]|uniref:DUF2730 family protein n=1 Tax=Azorhizobium doebereinerae TaxID=281091 RepID=UPI00048C3B42|nr:DUF2730 family protein [Azorhizobium doebereinerae]